MKSRMGKKGSIMDIFFIVLIVAALAITSVLAFVLLTKFNAQMQVTPGISQPSKDILSAAQAKFPKTFDGVFAIVLVFSIITTLFLASLVDVNPIFLPVSVVIFIFIVILCSAIGNTYYDLASNPELATYAQQFVIIPFVMNHLVEVMLVFGFAVAVVMYAKSRGG